MRLVIVSGEVSPPEAEFVARREASGSYAVYGSGEEAGQAYCATCTACEALVSLSALCFSQGIVQVIGALPKEEDALRESVPLVNTDSIAVGGGVCLVLDKHESHPALRDLLLWVRDERPPVSLLEQTTVRAVPACFVFRPLKVSGLSGVARIGEHLLAVDGALIEPSFTLLFERHYTVSSPDPSKSRPRPDNAGGLVAAGHASPLRRNRSSQPASQASPLPPSRIRRAAPPESSSQPESRPTFVLALCSESSEAAPASILEENRRTIRHHVLLALRSRDIDVRHPDFAAFVEQLSSGCKFTFRRTIATERIGASEIMADISSNMNHLKIGLQDL